MEFDIQIFADHTIWITLGLTGLLGGFLILALLFVYRLYRRQKSRLSSIEIEAFENGAKPNGNNENGYAHELVQYMPYNPEFEIPWNELVVEDQILGKGCFGIVSTAKVRGVTAAAKTIPEGSEKSVVLAFLAELKLMIYLGKHEHVAELIGANTSLLREGRPYIFMELCELGNLECYLKANRRNYDCSSNTTGIKQTSEKVKNYENAEVDRLSEETLVLWAYQIADGMDYLASKSVLHGDLAARNVLVKSVDQVKITDFGLARQIANYGAYVKTQKMPLPWRWLSIEALKDMIFSTKSDVWSYGVTLWEMFSLGQIPYPGLSWSPKFLTDLEDGLRLNRPKFASHDLYAVMFQCWDENPDKRPSFEELKNYFLNGDSAQQNIYYSKLEP